MSPVASSICCCSVAKLCPTLCDPHGPWTPWTHQAPMSMRFSRQEYWSRMPFPSLGNFPDQGFNLLLLHWQADSTAEPPGKPSFFNKVLHI